MKNYKIFDQMVEDIFDQMVEDWGSPIVARRSIRKFSGGLYGPKFMANEDCRGSGPAGGFTVGGQKCYPTQSVADWLKRRASKSWSERKMA